MFFYGLQACFAGFDVKKKQKTPAENFSIKVSDKALTAYPEKICYAGIEQNVDFVLWLHRSEIHILETKSTKFKLKPQC